MLTNNVYFYAKKLNKNSKIIIMKNQFTKNNKIKKKFDKK